MKHDKKSRREWPGSRFKARQKAHEARVEAAKSAPLPTGETAGESLWGKPETPSPGMPPTSEFFFILGHQPLISLAEIASVLASRGTPGFDCSEDKGLLAYEGSFAVANLPFFIDRRELAKTLGGTIKVGRILGAIDKPDAEATWQLLKDHRLLEFLIAKGKPVNFATSVYLSPKTEDIPIRTRRQLIDDVNRLAKRLLAEAGVSCRYLVWEGSSQAEPITSAQILRTHTLETGAEVCILWSENGLRIGITEAVQDLDAFAKRDMEKPYRRTTEGILPPKLARAMVNLCKRPNDKVLLDPFCGSGVVLMEGLQLGLTVIGSDNAQDAVDASRINVRWLYSGQKDLPELDNNFFYCHDVRTISEVIPPLSVHCIATEPYLGPPLRRPATPAEAAAILSELRPLYVEALAEMRIVLRPGGRIALVLPRFAGGEHGHGYGLDLVREMNLMGYKVLNPLFGTGLVSERPYLLYTRENQKVQREIWLLESSGENNPSP